MNNLEQTNNLTLIQLSKDFHSWIKGHTNLYNCLLKIKHFIVNNKILLLLIIIGYAILK